MSEPPPPKKRQGFWLTVGEIVAVLGLLVAGLNYWDSRQQHHEAVKKSAAEVRAAASFVIRGQASEDGRRVIISSVNPAQVIQSQRYFFPKAILAHPMEVTAAQPQIDLRWVEGGLRHAKPSDEEGESTVPVAIVTTFVENGESHLDLSIYRLGYAWRKGGLLGGMRLQLQGLALGRRSVTGEPRAAVEAAWAKPS